MTPTDVAALRTTLLALFIPSHDRDGNLRDDQDVWVQETLDVCGRLFGGGTAYPKGRGVWRDDARGGNLVYDTPVIFQCYTSVEAIEANVKLLGDHLLRMERETEQGAVAYVINTDYYEILITLE